MMAVVEGPGERAFSTPRWARLPIAVLAVGLLLVPMDAPACAGSVMSPPDPHLRDGCPGVENPQAGDTYLLAEGLVFHVDTPGPGDAVCVADAPGFIALSGIRDGTLIAVAADGSLHSIDPITTSTRLIPGDPFVTPVDIAVAGTGHVLVLESDAGGGVPGVSDVDPETGDVTPLTPPDGMNYLGADGAVPTSIAYQPGGGCLVAQLTDTWFSIVTIAPDGRQSLCRFAPPGELTATQLAVDSLSSGAAILLTDSGDVITVGLESCGAHHVGNLGDAASDLDVVATGVREAVVACGPNLYAIGWRRGEEDFVVEPIRTFADAVVSVSANRGPVPPGAVLAAHTFDDAESFADAFSVHRFGADGTAHITMIGTNGVLEMTTGWSEGPVPIAVRTESPVPLTGIHIEYDYLFQHPRARVDVFVNQRFAFSLPSPPAGRPGGPGSEQFAHVTREIILDRLGLLGAPRLVVEIRLTGMMGSPGTPTYVGVWLDNLSLLSSTCGSAFGDLTGDTILDLCDAHELTKDYGAYEPDWGCNDLNLDGYVDAIDYDILMQLIERDYLGCSPPSNPDSCVETEWEPIGEGNLIIVAKDAYWVDWLYEVEPDSPDARSPAVCLRRFRLPDADPDAPPVYTRIRHDGHGKLYAVSVSYLDIPGTGWVSGWIESWHNDETALAHSIIEIELPPAIADLEAIDVAVAHDVGLWGSYAPTGWAYESPEAIDFRFVHYQDGEVDVYTHGLYTRGRAVVAGAPGHVWGLTAQGESGVGSDRLINPVTQQVVDVSAINATLSADLMRWSGRLYLGGSVNGVAGPEGILHAYDVSGGMEGVSGPPLWSLPLADCTAVTGAAEDSAGALYVCGFKVVQVTGLDWWYMEPRLYRVTNYLEGDPQATDITPATCPGDFAMPLSLAVFRAATAGDYDADGDVDLYDFAAFQGCFNRSDAVCLDDFDLAPDPPSEDIVDLDDFTLFVGLMTD